MTQLLSLEQFLQINVSVRLDTMMMGELQYAKVKFILKINLECPYKCLTCENGTDCKTCKANSVVHRTFDSVAKTCECDADYYAENQTQSDVCLACYYTCEKCSNSNYKTCTLCPASS